MMTGVSEQMIESQFKQALERVRTIEDLARHIIL